MDEEAEDYTRRVYYVNEAYSLNVYFLIIYMIDF